MIPFFFKIVDKNLIIFLNSIKCSNTASLIIKSYFILFDKYKIFCFLNSIFVLKLLSSQPFLPIFRITKELNISWFEVSQKTADLLKDKNYNGKLKKLYA